MKNEDLYMNIKKISALVLTSVILSGVVGLKPAPVQASEKNAWATEYVKVLKKLDKKDKKDKNITYDLIYVDGDKTPELVISRFGYWVSLYTIYNGKAVAVMDQAVYGAMGNTGYDYIKKKNVIHNSNADFAGAEYYNFYGKISKGKLVDRNKEELCIKHYVDKNKNGMPDQNEYTDKSLYYYGKKQVSKATYEKYTVKGKLEMIMGKISYSKMLKKLNKAAK